MSSAEPSTRGSDLTGFIHSRESFGTLDGPGIRYVVFLQGCPLRCLYCHNPDTWVSGGESIEPEALFREVRQYREYLTGGVTFSGGEPLLQAGFVAECCQLFRQAGIHTALDTSGAMPLTPQVQEGVRQANLVILDLKSADTKQCQSLTGQGNERAFELLGFCEQERKPVWIRQVQVPGWTLEESQLRRLGRMIEPYRCIERVELLPYHKMAKAKYDALGIAPPLAATQPPTARQMSEAEVWLGWRPKEPLP
ncbi:MAG: pyruvate formate-lyase-activating protein [Kiritimatiellia bacterium]